MPANPTGVIGAEGDQDSFNKNQNLLPNANSFNPQYGAQQSINGQFTNQNSGEPNSDNKNILSQNNASNNYPLMPPQ